MLQLNIFYQDKKIKSKYILKEDHSQECETLFIKIDKKEIKTTLTKELYLGM